MAPTSLAAGQHQHGSTVLMQPLGENMRFDPSASALMAIRTPI